MPTSEAGATDSVLTRASVRELPKASLHCHLLGSVPAATAVELARTNAVELPGAPTVDSVYDVAAYEDLSQFLAVYDHIGQCLHTRDDFRRITYESLTVFGADHNVWYREISVSPQLSPLAYREVLHGVRDGMRDAKLDTGIDSRIIMAINREHSVASAIEFVQNVIDHRVDEVVGIGLDAAESKGSPELFTPAFELAHHAGLRCTAHSESGPPRNVEVLLDQLHCTRVDHGYHIVTDPRIVRRCIDEGILLTVTPVSSDIGRYSGSGDGTHRRIKEMVDLGLSISIDSDDPPMFGTDPTNDHYTLAAALNYPLPQLLSFTSNAIDGCWLDETDKQALRSRLASWAAERV